MQKKKQGISLIVLVITIIVMIILAATIIISLSNNGVINNAKDAVDKTNEKQVQEIANLAWGEAYADGKREVSDLQAAVENSLKANNLNPEDYSIQVTENGVTIKDINSVWIQKADRTVVKGDTVLNIGSDISYDETNGGTETGLTNVNWKVLGAENGELLIMSTSNINETLNIENTAENAKQLYENAVAELNKLCAPYGHGAYALGARSITVEDIDRITGYDKTTYGTGTMKEYGNVVTYKYNGTTKPAYECSNGVSGTLIEAHNNGFHWYDEEKGWQSVTASDLTNTENNGKEIGKVTSTYYYYNIWGTDLEGGSAGDMLTEGYAYYYLAATNQSVSASTVTFELTNFHNGEIGSQALGVSRGYFGFEEGYGIRPVVRLSPDFNP